MITGTNKNTDATDNYTVWYWDDASDQTAIITETTYTYSGTWSIQCDPIETSHRFSMPEIGYETLKIPVKGGGHAVVLSTSGFV